MLHRSVYAFVPGERIFVVSQGGQELRIWQLKEGWERGDKEGVEPRAQLSVPGGGVMALGVVAGEALVTVHREGRLRGWSLGAVLSGELELLWEEDLGFWLGAAQFYAGAGEGGRSLLALGGEGGEVALWEVKGGLARELEGGGEAAHGEQVEVLAISGDGRFLASGGQDRRVVIWEVGAGGLKRRRMLEGVGGWPLALAFSPDGRRLVSGCMDNGVYLWDLGAEETLKSVRFDHAGWVGDVSWTEDGQRVLSASWDNRCGVFDGESLRPLYQFSYHSDYVVRVMAVPGGAQFLAGSYDGEVSLWDGERGELVHVFRGHQDWVTELVWIGGGEFLSLSSDGGVRVWSLEEMELRAVLGDVAEESFELGGSFDLASFGLEGEVNSASLGEVVEAEEEFLGDVVRRFDEGDPMVDLGPQQTAMDMLEGGFEGGERFEEVEELGGDEGLSDLVWSAISEADEESASEMVESVFEEVVGLAPEVEPVVGGEANSEEPEYDPQPIKAGDDLGDILLDEEELDLVFGEAVSVPLGEVFVEEEAKEEERSGDVQTVSLDPGRLKSLSRRFQRHLAREAEALASEEEESGGGGGFSSPEWEEELAEVVTQRLDSLSEEGSEEVSMRAPGLFDGRFDESEGEEGEESGLASRRFGEFQRRERTFGRRQLSTPVIEELRSGVQSLKMDGFAEGVRLEEGGGSDEEAVDGEGIFSGGGERLQPGEAGEIGGLRMPEAEPTVVQEVQVEEEPGGVIDEVELGSLWEGARQGAPSMRVLRRSVEYGVGYELARELETGLRGRMKVAISPSERRILGVDSRGMAEVWQTRGAQALRVRLSDEPLVDGGFVKGDQFFWALGEEGDIQLLMGAGEEVSRAVIRGEGGVRCGHFIERQDLLLTGGVDGRARLWSLKEGKEVAVFADHQGPLTAVAIGRRGPITASGDGQICFWDRRGVLVDQLQSASPVVELIAREGLVVWGQADGGLQVLREGQGRPGGPGERDGALRGLAFREDGFFISGGEDGRVLIYDGAQEEPVQEIKVPAPIHDLAVSERVLALACEGGRIFLYRRESKKL